MRVSLDNFSFLSFFPSYLFLAQPTHSTWHARATSLDAHLIVLDLQPADKYSLCKQILKCLDHYFSDLNALIFLYGGSTSHG